MLERNEDKRYTVKFACLDSLVPENYLLRKIAIYPMVEHLYCEDNGRPSADPVVLVKMALLQHLYGIRSLRRTYDEVEMNIAYRWFIGYDIDTPGGIMNGWNKSYNRHTSYRTCNARYICNS